MYQYKPVIVHCYPLIDVLQVTCCYMVQLLSNLSKNQLLSSKRH